MFDEEFHQPGWVGCAVVFLALCKVGFVSGLCAPCNVLKIAWGSFGKVSGCVKLVRCVQQGDVQRQVFMQYGHSVLRQLGTLAEQRYKDENMHIS